MQMDSNHFSHSLCVHNSPAMKTWNFHPFLLALNSPVTACTMAHARGNGSVLGEALKNSKKLHFCILAL
jgi:hypothetical protein